MNKKWAIHIKSIAITLLSLALSFIIGILLQNSLGVTKPIELVFVFGVFLVSLVTEGYVYGILAAFLSVFSVNFAFTFPYFAFNFTIYENLVSAMVMIVISLMTSALTTKLKRSQALRAEAEMEKTRANLLRAVSHDLRTPLTTIYGSSSAILENGDALTAEQKAKMLSGIKQDSEWLIRMVENLLSVTRIDSGEIRLIKTPTVLEELVDSVIVKFKKRYPHNSINVDMPDEIVIIPMDALLIEQVVLNILENAVRHAHGMSELSLRITAVSEKTIFEISDNGCGIDTDKLKRIFDGYNDPDKSPSDTRDRVSGIGLSVCATIIRAHGGTISAKNSESGGAVFTFELYREESTEIEEQ